MAFGAPPEGFDPETLVGFAERVDGAVTAFGGVALIDAAPVAFFCGAARPQHHRLALRLFESLDAEGVARVFAAPDPEIAGAATWMRRLGFRPVGNGEVWARDLGGD